MMKLNSKKRLTAFDIALIFRQLATLITAGLPLLEALEAIEKNQSKQLGRQLMYTIKVNVIAGHHLSHSLKRFPFYFDAITCQLILLAEKTGKLDNLLEKIANHLEAKIAFKQKISRALFYPSLILGAAILLVSSLFIFIIPRFAALFQTKFTNLPLLTRGIFFLATNIQQHLGILLFGFIMLGFLIYYAYQTHLKHHLNTLLMSIPYCYRFYQRVFIVHFAQHLAIMLEAGIPLLDALQLLSTLTKHPKTHALTKQLRHKIMSGNNFYQAMSGLYYFPTMMLQLIKIGEMTGSLETMLIKSANFIEADIDNALKRLHEALEPLIILILGALIGMVVIAMYLPIFQLGTTF